MSTIETGVTFILEYCPKCQGMRMAQRRVIGQDVLGERAILHCVKCKTSLTGAETPCVDTASKTT